MNYFNNGYIAFANYVLLDERLLLYDTMIYQKKEKKKKENEDERTRGNTCIFQTKIFLNKISVKKTFVLCV